MLGISTRFRMQESRPCADCGARQMLLSGGRQWCVICDGTRPADSRVAFCSTCNRSAFGLVGSPLGNWDGLFHCFQCWRDWYGFNSWIRYNHPALGWCSQAAPTHFARGGGNLQRVYVEADGRIVTVPQAELTFAFNFNSASASGAVSSSASTARTAATRERQRASAPRRLNEHLRYEHRGYSSSSPDQWSSSDEVCSITDSLARLGQDDDESELHEEECSNSKAGSNAEERPSSNDGSDAEEGHSSREGSDVEEGYFEEPLSESSSSSSQSSSPR